MHARQQVSSRRTALTGTMALVAFAALGCSDATAPDAQPTFDPSLNWSVQFPAGNAVLDNFSTAPNYQIYPGDAYSGAVYRTPAASITGGVMTVDVWDGQTQMGTGGTRQQSWLSFEVPGLDVVAPASGRVAVKQRAGLQPASAGQYRPLVALGRTVGSTNWVYAGFRATGDGTFDYTLARRGRRWLEVTGEFVIPVESVGLTPAVNGTVRGELHMVVPRN